MIRGLLVLSLVALSSPAQAAPVEPLGGVALDLTLADSGNINPVNYENQLDLHAVPAWRIGRVWLRGTRFERLTLSARFSITYPLVVDGSTSPTLAFDGTGLPCTGTDPSQVPRCSGPGFRTPWSDLPITLGNPRIYTIPVVGLHLDPALQVALPTSLESQHAARLVSLLGSLGLSRHFWGERVRLGYRFAARKDLVRSGATALPGATLGSAYLLTPGFPTQALTPPPPGPQGAAFTDEQFLYLASTAVVDFGLTHIVSVQVNPIRPLGVTVLYAINQNFAFPAPCLVEFNGVPTNLCSDGSMVGGSADSPVTIRESVSQVFLVGLSYQALDWLGLFAAFTTAGGMRKPDGSLRQPFYDQGYSSSSRVSLGLDVSIDRLAVTLLERRAKAKAQGQAR